MMVGEAGLRGEGWLGAAPAIQTRDLDQNPNPPLPRRTLSHPEQGLRARSGGCGGPLLSRSGDCLTPPRDARQVAPASSSADTVPGDTDSAPIPTRDPPASARTPHPGARGAAALCQAGPGGWPTPAGALGAALQPFARCRGGGGRSAPCGDAPSLGPVCC